MFKIKVKQSIKSIDEVRPDQWIEIDSSYFKNTEYNWNSERFLNSIPIINSHDHLIGNWYPRSGTNAPYINSHIWVEDNKTWFQLSHNLFHLPTMYGCAVPNLNVGSTEFQVFFMIALDIGIKLC